MKVFVDADNCEKTSRKIILKACTRNKIEVILAANREIPIKTQNVTFRMEICEKAKDSADNFIFENASTDDIVITRDILLAKRLIEKGICTMNDMGRKFTKENMDDILEQRELSLQMKALGISNGTSFRSYSSANTEEFSKTFNEALNARI